MALFARTDRSPETTESEKTDVRYNVSLPPPVNEALAKSADKLHITKAEAIRRALLLFNYAVDADKVELTKGSEKQSVLIK